jgi:WD40 repeat protein
VPDTAHATEEAPRPERIATRQEFSQALTLLREQAGLSVRDVARRTAARGQHTTLGGWFAGQHLPSASSTTLLVSVLAVCGVTEREQVRQWLTAWKRVRLPPGPRPGGIEPYRGLARFEAEHAEWFFGRQSLTTELLERMGRASPAGGSVHLVVGASGSGKSSLLRAGMIPALMRDGLPGARSVTLVLLTPGPRPGQALGHYLAPLLDTAGDRVARPGSPGPTTAGDLAVWARQAASHVAAAGPDHRLVLVVDQLEEVFTSDEDEPRRQGFLAALCAAAEGPRGAHVVLGLRADFYAQALLCPELVQATQGAQVNVGPMNETELREAIVRPAQKAGIEIEAGLVEILLQQALPHTDTAGGTRRPAQGVLPLLSHALRATWEQEHARRISLDGFRRVGGIDGAVATTAEKLFGELAQEQQRAARQLLLTLVHVAVGVSDTRRRLAYTELPTALTPGAEAAIEEVLDRLIEARLVTADADGVELSHEALLTAWPRLRSWLDTDRHRLLTRQQLVAAADAWHREGHDPSLLYRGSRLDAAQEWATDQQDDIPAPVSEFITAAIRRGRREQRRLRGIAVTLALLLMLSVTATAIGFHQQSITTRQRDTALSRTLADEATALRTVDPALAAQLGLAAYRLMPTAQARGSLLSTFAQPYANRLPAPESVYAVAFTPNGHTLATASRNGTVQLWDMSTPHHPAAITAFPTHHVGNPYAGAVDAAAFSPDGRLLATASWDRTIRLWDLTDPRHPRQVATLTGHQGPVRTVAFAPRGPVLATGSDDRTIRLWDLTDRSHPRQLATLTGYQATVRSVAFSPDGTLLASGSEDHTERLWKITDPHQPRPLARLTNTTAILAVAISPNGRTLAAGGDDGTAQLQDITLPDRPRSLARLTGHTGAVLSVTFSPDGRTLATGSDDNTARLWNVTTSRSPKTAAVLTGHTDTVLSVAFSPDGKTLATGSDDFSARLWDVAAPTATLGDSTFNSVAFSPDGRLLATGSADRTTTLWDTSSTAGPTVLTVLADHDSAVFAVAFSPDGHLLASGGLDGLVRLWQITDPRHPSLLATLIGITASFSPSGRTLATGGLDRRVRLWDIASPRHPRRLATLTGPTNLVSSTAFSPNGRLLASAGWDRTTRLWDLVDPHRPALQAVLPGTVVAFSPEGLTLATGNADRLIRLWDLASFPQVHSLATLRGHAGAITSLAFDTQGKNLVSAAQDHTVRLWNLSHRTDASELATLIGHTDVVRAVAFSPDGQQVASAGSDQTLRVWETSPADVAARVCTQANPPISHPEWHQYLPGLPYRPPC